MRFLNLTGGDIRRLTSRKMLTDKLINAAQKLLVKEFRVFENFQNPLVSQMNLFKSIPQKAKSIQVHHVRTNHWILSTTTNGCVEVFDSVYDDLSADTRTQLSTV